MNEREIREFIDRGMYKLEAAERAVYRREVDEEDRKVKERREIEKQNVIKTKQYEEELSELEDAMNGMKDELEKKKKMIR
jgi:hypothetical protein